MGYILAVVPTGSLVKAADVAGGASKKLDCPSHATQDAGAPSSSATSIPQGSPQDGLGSALDVCEPWGRFTLSARLIFVSGLFGCVPWAVLNTFMTDMLAVDKQLGVGHATAILLTFGFGGFVGSVVGTVLGDFLYSRRKRLPSLL